MRASSSTSLGALLLIGSGSVLMAGEPGYRLSIDSSVQDRQLSVTPRIAGPGGTLRYEMTSTKLGASGRSVTRQSGQVAADAAGAALATLRLGVGEGDRYEISVKVYADGKLVAEQVLQHPPS